MYLLDSICSQMDLRAWEGVLKFSNGMVIRVSQVGDKDRGDIAIYSKHLLCELGIAAPRVLFIEN